MELFPFSYAYACTYAYVTPVHTYFSYFPYAYLCLCLCQSVNKPLETSMRRGQEDWDLIKTNTKSKTLAKDNVPCLYMFIGPLQ